MIDRRSIPDPGLPLAHGYYLQHARAALQAEGITTPEQFTARYGVELFTLTAFELLWTVNRARAAQELHLNELYRAGMWHSSASPGGEVTGGMSGATPVRAPPHSPHAHHGQWRTITTKRTNMHGTIGYAQGENNDRIDAGYGGAAGAEGGAASMLATGDRAASVARRCGRAGRWTRARPHDE